MQEDASVSDERMQRLSSSTALGALRRLQLLTGHKVSTTNVTDEGEDAMESRLEAGSKAPSFSLLDQEGRKVTLKGFAGRKTLVYFYPKANTPGCTKQSCGLRDVRDDIGDTVILGISPDEPESQKKFDEKHGLGFPLLSDVDHATAEAYGVWGERSLYGKKFMGIIRSAFLIDEKGLVESAWYKISPDDTPKKLVAALKGSAKR